MNDLTRPDRTDTPAPLIEFGSGTVAAVGALGREHGFTRTLVVADAFNAARVDLLALRASVTVFGEVEPEPDIPNLREAARRGRGSASPTWSSASAVAAPWTSPSWRRSCPAAARPFTRWSGRKR